jgi:ubiquinone/menaquinone biosynthesis C-methylase UbiE
MGKQISPTFDIEVTDKDPIRFYRWPIIGKLYQRRINKCIELLPEGHRVLEIGFGSGVSIPKLISKFSAVHGIDLDARVIRVNNDRLHLSNANVLSIPYSDEYFDSVLAISIFEHLRPMDLPTAMKEVKRVLKPNGQFVYGVPIERKLMVLAFKLLGCNIREHHFSTEREIRDAAKTTFRVELARTLKAFGMVDVYEIVRCNNA